MVHFEEYRQKFVYFFSIQVKFYVFLKKNKELILAWKKLLLLLMQRKNILARKFKLGIFSNWNFWRFTKLSEIIGISSFVEITRFFPEMQLGKYAFSVYKMTQFVRNTHLAQFASLLAKKTNKSVGKERRMKRETISHACIQKCWENWPWRISLRQLENFILMNK